MIRKKFSLLLLSHSGSSIRQITISRFSLVVLALAGIVGLAGLSFVLNDYGKLRNASIDAGFWRARVESQRDEIATQRKQIQQFAADIDSLKENLAALQAFEHKIRIIANLEDPEKGDGLFGMGGALPDDLDPQLPLERKHNQLIRRMHEQVDQLDYAAVNQEEGFASLFGELEDQVNLLACTPAIRPASGWLTSRFGYRKSPFTGKREFHKGYDIASRKGTPVISTADGVARFSGRKGLMGKMVVIDHGYGMVTRYAHLNKALVKVGQPVKRGDRIGLIGNTGRSTGSHLHYEVHVDGVPVNPAKYILD